MRDLRDNAQPRMFAEQHHRFGGENLIAVIADRLQTVGEVMDITDSF